MENEKTRRQETTEKYEAFIPRIAYMDGKTAGEMILRMSILETSRLEQRKKDYEQLKERLNIAFEQYKERVKELEG